MSGHANIAAPADQHVAAMQKLRDMWSQQNYQITGYHTFPRDGRQGRLAARIPADGISISLQSTEPPRAFALLIGTPCYQPAPGEQPAG